MSRVSQQVKHKISVIIPAYNHARYVTRAIDSVFAQTYKSFEIIVVDDGSTDNTRQVLEPYLASRQRGLDRVKYIYQENRGLAGARNTGIRNSSGEYLQFLDADDELLPTKLEFHMNIMEGKPEIKITASSWQLIDNKGKPLIEQRKYYKKLFGIEDIIFTNPFVVEALMFRRECFTDDSMFNEDMRFCEDIDMWLRLAVKGYKFYCYPIKLVKIHRISGSMSYNNPFKMSEYRLKILDKFFASPGLKPEIEALKGKSYFTSYRSFAWAYYSGGYLSEGRKYLKEMVKIIPGILLENKFFFQLDNFFKPFGYMYKRIALKDFKMVEKEVFDFLNELYVNPDLPASVAVLKKRAYSNAFLGVSIRYLKFRRTKKFLDCFLRAFILSPDFVLRSVWVYPHIKALLGPFLFVIRVIRRI